MSVKNSLIAQNTQAAFAQRKDLVHQTGERLGLTVDNAVIIGGAGLALHGLDSRIDQDRRRHPFDVDAYVEPDFFNRLTLTDNEKKLVFGLRSTLMPNGKQIDPPVTPLQFTGFDGRWTTDFHRGRTRYENYMAAQQDCVEVEGLPTVSAAKLAEIKVQVGRSKDLAGVIKAHIVGYHQSHPITSDPDWVSQVRKAANRLSGKDIYRPSRMHNRVPMWLGKLVRQEFDHPAFDAVHS